MLTFENWRFGVVSKTSTSNSAEIYENSSLAQSKSLLLKRALHMRRHACRRWRDYNSGTHVGRHHDNVGRRRVGTRFSSALSRRTKKEKIDTADTWSHDDATLTRAMKSPDLFSVISANFQLGQKSNNGVTFRVLRSETHSMFIQPLLYGLQIHEESLLP
jgi:hypothetical protein